MRNKFLTKTALAVLTVFSITLIASKSPVEKEQNVKVQDGLEVATLGAGCFWCVEAIFQEVKGVKSVTSGYMGGHINKPTYKEVCSGNTGHAEVAQLTFNPKEVSYKEILEIFWQTHDPTTLNRQGNDVGSQYRSAIFYHNEEQKKEAEFYKMELDESEAFSAKIVTEIVPASEFYKAEGYHQDYYSQNENAPYCQAIIRPKVDKFKKAFSNKLK